MRAHVTEVLGYFRVNALEVSRRYGFQLRSDDENDRILAAGLARAWPGPLPAEVVPIPRWGYVHYVFPGLLTSTTLLAGLFGMGYAMVRYRQSLFLKKLAATRLPRSTFVLAQVAARAVLVLAQAAILLVVAGLALELPITATSSLLVAGFVLLGFLVFTGIGFLLASAVKTEGVMVDVINALGTALVFVSEMFFPNDTLPSWLAAITRLLPSTILVGAIRAVLVFGETRPAVLLGPAVGLAAWAVAVMLWTAVPWRARVSSAPPTKHPRPAKAASQARTSPLIPARRGWTYVITIPSSPRGGGCAPPPSVAREA